MRWLLLTVLFFSGQLPISHAAEFFVSTSGNDRNSGSRAEPFASLTRAQQAARAVAGKEPVTITLAGGTYYLPATLVFTAEDSGSEKAPVVYRKAPGEQVVISGGQKLSLQWKTHTNSILKAATPPDLHIDQLFVNGRVHPMARYPNGPDGFSADAFSPERAARWADPAGGFMHVLHRALWGGFHYRITGKNATNGLQYEGGWQNNRQSGMHRDFRFVENILEELDAPAEWFHDRKQNVLYLIPPAEMTNLPGGLDTAVVEIAHLRHLIEFTGSQKAPVKFITLEGLTFRHTARTFMETKEPLLRSDWTIYRGGAVVFNGAEDCALANCTFDQVGGNAVFVNNYNRRVAIRACQIRDAGASGVAFVGDPDAVRNPLFEYGQRQKYADIDRTPGPRTDHYPADCLVEDCWITRIGRVEKQSAGVQISMSQGITVRHCTINDVPRAGINIGDGSWGGHLIEGCDVFDTVQETGDHGSFNSWGRDRYWRLDGAPLEELSRLALLDAVKTTVIRNNRWRCDHGWDVDLDDGSSNYEIYNNVMLNGGLKLREGFHRVVYNNVMVNNSLHPHVWFTNSADVVTNNIFMGPLRPAAMNKDLNKWGHIDRNLYTTSEADRLKYADKGCDTNSLVGDALFVDFAKADFRVKDGSPALKLGFRNFPMNEFGVRTGPKPTPLRQPLKSKSVSDEPSGPVAIWKGATLRNLAGEEFSAVGVPRSATGVLVANVPADSAAANAGLRFNDFIQAIDGRPVRNQEDFFKRIDGIPSGTKVMFTVIRDQSSVQIQVEAGPTPSQGPNRTR